MDFSRAGGGWGEVQVLGRQGSCARAEAWELPALAQWSGPRLQPHTPRTLVTLGSMCCRLGLVSALFPTWEPM